jgi:hypothetical protein
VNQNNHEGDGDLSFLRSYESTTLWKPQVVADNVLTGIFLADSSYRVALAALLLQEAAEAARRLAAVWHALADRTLPVARRLRGPLPGSEGFASMADAIGMMEAPEEVLRLLAVDESALDSATELAAFGGLSWFTEVVRTAEAGPPSVRVEPNPEPGQPPVLWWSGHDASGAAVETRLVLADEQVIALGDATGDFVTWAREFLAAYIDARAATAGPER